MKSSSFLKSQFYLLLEKIFPSEIEIVENAHACAFEVITFYIIVNWTCKTDIIKQRF